MIKYCQSCNSIITKGKKCDDCRSGSHGLKWSELEKLALAQELKCPILGTPFEIDYDRKKIIDKDPMSKKIQRVCVDHCHDTMIIRGLLSDMGNMLVGGFDRRRYGITSNYRPEPMIKYLESKIAQTTLGERTFRS
jgi:hypothetical protein